MQELGPLYCRALFAKLMNHYIFKGSSGTCGGSIRPTKL